MSPARCRGHDAYGASQEGHAFGRGRGTILRRAWKAGELPISGVADVGARRSAGADRPAPIPAKVLDRQPWALRRCWRAGDGAHGAHQARDRARRDRPRTRRRRSLRLRPGRCGLRPERAVPPRPERTRPCLVSRRTAHPKGVRHERRTPVPSCEQRKASQARGAQRGRPGWRGRADGLPLAAYRLEAGQQRCACCPFRGPAGAGRRRTTQPATRPLARRGGLARRRMAQQRRAQILPEQSAAGHLAAPPRRHDQGALGVRAGAPAAQAGTRTRRLRGTILDRAEPAKFRCEAIKEARCIDMR